MKVTIDNFSRINTCEYIVLYLNIKNNKIVGNKNNNNCSKTMSNMDIDNTTMFNVSDFIDQYNFENKRHKSLTDYLNQNYELVCHAIMQEYSGINIKEFDENHEYNYPNIFQTVSINGNYVDQLFCKELFVSVLTWLDPILAYDIQRSLNQVSQNNVCKYMENDDEDTVVVSDDSQSTTLSMLENKVANNLSKKKNYEEPLTPYIKDIRGQCHEYSFVVSKIFGKAYDYIEAKFIQTKTITKNMIEDTNNIFIHGIKYTYTFKENVHKYLDKIFKTNKYQGNIEYGILDGFKYVIPLYKRDELKDDKLTDKIIDALIYAAKVSNIRVIRQVIDKVDTLTISTNINLTDCVYKKIDDYFIPDTSEEYSDDESSGSWGDDFSECCTESYTNSNDSYAE